MVFKCSKGMYLLKNNYRDAFKLEAFEEKYLEECFDKDMYIVGDISSEILRLKGFDNDPKSKNYYGFIEDYLDISCAFGCPYFILKRIKNEDEYRKLEKENKPVITEDDRVAVKPIVKENFDKESLVLKTSQKSRPHIVIDPKKMNSIPKGELPLDLKEDKSDFAKPKVANNAEPEKPVVVETFVSSSEDFDPSKKQDRFKNNNFKNNRPNNNNNNHQNNKPKNNENKPKNDVKPQNDVKSQNENKPVDNKEGNNNNRHNRNRHHNRNRNGNKPKNEGQQ